MADHAAIARPYAQAVFEEASATDNVTAWSEMLALAAAIVRDPAMTLLLGSPRLTKQGLADLLIEIAGARFNTACQNLIRLLAENRRLALLPALAGRYEALRIRAEGTLEAEVSAAQPLSDSAKTQIADALARRFQRRIQLASRVDSTLLGGAVIRVGDVVIDGSVRGKLGRLAQALAH